MSSSLRLYHEPFSAPAFLRALENEIENGLDAWPRCILPHTAENRPQFAGGLKASDKQLRLYMVKYVEARDGCQLNLPSVFTTQAQQLTFIIKSCTILFCFNQRDKKKVGFKSYDIW